MVRGLLIRCRMPMHMRALLLSTCGVIAPAVATAQVTPYDPAPPTPLTEPGSLEPSVDDPIEPTAHATFGREGMIEVGVSAGLTMAQDIRVVNLQPQVAWFIRDQIQLAGIVGLGNLKAGEGSSATIWTLLIEPSLHLPIGPSLFGFVAMGVGAAYVDELGAGIAVAPRIGLDVLVGERGILRPSLQYAYTTQDAMAAVNDDGTTSVTLVAISSTLRFNLGYSMIW
jgi:hypothetical protein